MLRGKRILLGVSGGIAVYKAVDLVSRLKKAGAEVFVVMTKSAAEFVSPITFRSLSHHPVYLNLFEEPRIWDVEHIGLAENVDAAVVAPATANIIAKMAAGLADDYLSTVLLAVTQPIFAAPAMNHKMYHHPATQKNLEVLQKRGVRIIGPGSGFQACGTSGDGRMSEPAEIVSELERFFVRSNGLAGKKVLVTAGGTKEPLDPVRYLGNHSSGKMGFALAQACAEAGAEVVLVHTQVELPLPLGVRSVFVRTAGEMYEEVTGRFPETDIVIKAAAVADYRPLTCSEQKIKKSGSHLTLELVPNPDILAELGRKKQHQFLVGFAAETENAVDNAFSKLQRKNADLLVVNDVTKPGAGFGTETNIVSLIFPDGSREDLPRMSKLDIAREIVRVIVSRQS
ncbi:Phosphopantothenoylcysteine decarboxylase; Phosphopantothenate-cysteine ligase [Syntrophobotulus glycolicus DSM 8271]|uniref:Coenzyme A biosynthesis bifunctional protein CoaBC n=1 Tax=Syntrophobotulus glycolicus (strain DSM 8271 / FlGlyR) TaxID=645991 RepID=F0T0J1_SYNGF|nr:bifunctional phosphopantothenoylcysteine decarboxylase/phosphopantothenate--cysteine ligase CoaBC [Syntrophobotulus glycolicus]ADY55056.1 Phosphopantothenoylcysteine decarboxylase; Phosphopantothenate-cysteine ligase [Syntrophobotulus glycolicus DSM 8271]